METLLRKLNRKNYLRLQFLFRKSTIYAGQKCPPYFAVTTDNWKIRRQCPTWPTYFIHTVLHVSCCLKCLFVHGPFCHHALDLTCLHGLQHIFFEHHFNLYLPELPCRTSSLAPRAVRL